MFTVIFAEKETIKLFEETKMFFGPLYNSEKIAFCEWNKDADDFDAMVPDIYDLIEYHSEWRAIVLYKDGFEQLNPFDFTGYSEPYGVKSGGWDYYKERRNQRIAAYEKAASNPLVKLTSALSGVAGAKSVIVDEDYAKILSGDLQTYEYMLIRQLGAIKCSEVAARIDKYQRDDLKRFVGDDEIDSLLSSIRNADASGIVKLIPDTAILEFIRYIGNDPIYSDPEYTECLIENTKKNELLDEIADNFTMKDKLPTEVICVSPRTFDFENYEQDVKWRKRDEASSSRFANFNLYSDRLKFMLYDVLPQDHRQYRFELMKFLCLVLVVANNVTPPSLIKANNVYRAEMDFNEDAMVRVCATYVGKLKATQRMLKEVGLQLDFDSDKSVDDRTVRRLFESDVHIPVEIPASKSETDLYAEYDHLGLSTDCPEDEAVYWSKQYKEINKRFARYLREPRRAVKTAVNDGMKTNNVIDDDRTLLLNENQIEDVKFHIDEMEQKLVESTTTHLFDTKKFTEELQEADKEIKRGIAQRMTRKKTIIVGLIGLLAYFIGFFPLMFSNLNTVKSFLFSFMLTGILLGAFLVVSFLFLFVLRKKLVNRFKHFNYVMSGICSRINSAMGQFSRYISCACNVMRDFSVLRKRDSKVVRTKKILRYHDSKMTEQITTIHEVFNRYVDFNKLNIKDCDPYEYDFTVLHDYEYEMPDAHSKRKIEYLQQGNEVTVPLAYIESITLVREELYD